MVILIVINGYINSYYWLLIDDYNRVKLSITPGEPGSDYINASFIDVSTHPHT